MSLQNKSTQLLGRDDQDTSDDVDDIFSQYGAGDDIVSQPSNDAVISEEKSPQIESVITAMNEGVTLETPDKKVSDDVPAKDIFDVDDEILEESVVLPEELSVEEKKWEKSVPEKVVVPLEEKSDSIPVAAPVHTNINAVVQSEPTQKQRTIKKSVQLPQKAQKREVHIDPSKKTIMIVDDDLDTLDMYADIFESADYNVIRASDGFEALNTIGDHTPHLIFTGIVMPRMDGFAMMEALAQNPRTAEIPVVINSHLGRAADKARAEDLGAKDFIVRGFTPPREALERIGALLLRSEYTFRFDHNETEARKLAKDLGASNFFVCPRGQEMVIKMSVTDPQNLTFSARFSCIDEKKDK